MRLHANKSGMYCNHDLDQYGTHWEAEYCDSRLEYEYLIEGAEEERVWNPLLNAAYGENKNLFSKVLAMGIQSDRPWMTDNCFAQCTKSFDLEFINDLLARDIFDLSPSYRAEMLSLAVRDNIGTTLKDIIQNHTHELDSEDIEEAFRNAISYRKEDMMRILLDSGYWPDRCTRCDEFRFQETQDRWQNNILVTALRSKYEPIRQAILDHYQKHAIELQGSDAKPHFMRAYNTALKLRDIDMAKMLAIETRFTVGTYIRSNHGKDHYFSTVQSAAYYKEYDLVHWLLDQNVDLDTLEEGEDDVHSTLQYASMHEEAGVVQRLLAKGANVNTKPVKYRGSTAVQFTAMTGHLEVLELLIRAGADINAPPGPF